jgi:hypothetical protein
MSSMNRSIAQKGRKRSASSRGAGRRAGGRRKK